MGAVQTMQMKAGTGAPSGEYKMTENSSNGRTACALVLRDTVTGGDVGHAGDSESDRDAAVHGR